MSSLKFYNTTEWKILLVGIVLTTILLGVGGYFLVSGNEIVQTSGLIFLAHTLGGRAAGIGLSIMNNFSYFWTIAYNMYLEILIVCVTYSVSILSINNYIKLRALKYYALRLERKAKRHQDKLEKYGWLGLFLFVMAPLPVTGPVIGTIAGHLLKFNIIKNFSASLSGTLASIVIWTIFFDYLQQHLKILQYILGALVLIVLISNFKELKRKLL